MLPLRRPDRAVWAGGVVRVAGKEVGGCGLPVAGYGLQVTVCRLLVCGLPVVSLRVRGAEKEVAGCRLQVKNVAGYVS